MSGRVSSLWALCGAGKPQGAYLEDAVVTLLDFATCGRRGSAGEAVWRAVATYRSS